jgi:hypothetical protein
MIKRALQDSLEASLRKYPVVGIVGSRQGGWGSDFRINILALPRH